MKKGLAMVLCRSMGSVSSEDEFSVDLWVQFFLKMNLVEDQ